MAAVPESYKVSLGEEPKVGKWGPMRHILGPQFAGNGMCWEAHSEGGTNDGKCGDPREWSIDTWGHCLCFIEDTSTRLRQYITICHL